MVCQRVMISMVIGTLGLFVACECSTLILVSLYSDRTSRMDQCWNGSRDFLCHMEMYGTKIYEDKHFIGINFPTFCHVSVLFFGPIEIRRRTGLQNRLESRTLLSAFLQGMGRGWREAIVIYSRYSRQRHGGDDAVTVELIISVCCVL